MNHNIFRDTDPINAEFLRHAEAAVKKGFMAAYELHERLGPAGAETMEENQFGDTTLAMDIGSEEAMRNSLKTLPYRFLVRSEELGEFELNEHISGPRYLAVMDGLDGSSVLKDHFGEAGHDYAAMLNIFANDNPTYDDYVVGGIMVLSSGEMFIAKKDEELLGENVKTGERWKVRADQTAILDEHAVVFADASEVSPDHSLHGFFTLNGAIANKLHEELGVQPFRTGSTAANLVAIAKGEATLGIEPTRKGNLELASGYAVIKASGGVMQTLGGKDLGKFRFLEFGQGLKEHIPVIAAANKDVADKTWSTLAKAS